MRVTRYPVMWLFGLGCMSPATVFAQGSPRLTISGRVIDDSTSIVLQNVNVFLAQTTLGCSTNQFGQFELRNVPPGSYEMVASRIGYAVHSVQVTISQSAKREFEIRLHPSAVRLGEVVISAPEPADWKTQLKKFTTFFLGGTRNAEQCTILNPEVLDFVESGQFFSATARAPVEVENQALGYRLQFFLTVFTTGLLGSPSGMQDGTSTLKYEGLPRYTELQATTPEEHAQWEENRLRAYRGSMRHFLTSLIRRETEREGFVMHLVPFVMGTQVDRYQPASPYAPAPRNKSWDLYRKEVSEAELVSSGAKPDEWIVRFKGILEVEYTKGYVEREYDLLVKSGTDHQVSWLQLTMSSVTVNSRGLIKEFWPTKVSGYWAWHRIADALPLDFDPEKELPK